jgi:hypothetical protein
VNHYQGFQKAARGVYETTAAKAGQAGRQCNHTGLRIKTTDHPVSARREYVDYEEIK